MEDTQTCRKIEYVNNCEGLNRIIPVTVFLVMLFNACFLYQPKADTNLLIAALNGFGYGMTLSDDIFMNTLSKFFHFDKLLKYELFAFLIPHHQIIHILNNLFLQWGI